MSASKTEGKKPSSRLLGMKVKKEKKKREREKLQEIIIILD